MDDGRQTSRNNDWVSTIEKLMVLARESSAAFEYDRALGYLSTIEDIWDSKGLPDFSRELRLELHSEKGKALASLGRLDEAIEEYQRVTKHCRESDDQRTRAETFTQIGQLLGKQGDHDRALGYHQRAIRVYRRLDDQLGLCKALRNLGVSFIELGEFEEAEDTYKNAVAIAGTFKDKILYADLINNLGAISNMRGNWRRARDLYLESLKIYTSQEEKRKAAYTRNNLGITFSEQGMIAEASEYFRAAFETATLIKDASLTLIININLADLYLKQGRLEEAAQHSSDAESYLVAHDLTNGHLVEVKKTAGRIACLKGNFEDAQKYLNDALKISQQLGTQFLEAEVLLERGSLLRTMGRHFDALTDLEASYSIYTSLKAEGKKETTENVIGSIEGLYLEIFDSIAKDIDLKDKYTKGHSDRVASLSLLLAKQIGLRGSDLKTIVAGALLHDIGKLKINDNVLKKPDRLSADEFSHIKMHPQYGIELMKDKEFPWDIRPLVLHHHERFDGSGYPHGLSGEAIPLGARLVCVADVFDALTSDRVYRPAFAPQKALAIMEQEAGTFDPVLLKRFKEMIESGQADLVINSRTRDGEMYSIWSQCMKSEQDATATGPLPIPEHAAV